MHQEFEKEPNLDYYYNEEEEEEVEGGEEEENEEEGGENNNKKKKKEEDIDNKDNKEEDKKDENKGNVEDKKINENEENKINDENKNMEKTKEKNKSENNIINEENKNSEKKGNENQVNEVKKINENNQINENKINEDNNINDRKDVKDNIEKKGEKVDVSESIVNTENQKQQIEEEIDTTIPKTNKMIQNVTKNGDIIIQSFSPNTICHRIIPKGSDLDINKKGCFKCYKIKAKKNLMSFITGTKIIKVPYLIFLDENYYYMSKDKIVNQRKPNLRRIGNRYDLLKLSNFQTTRKGNDYEFAFEFVNNDIFDRNFKLLYFTPKEAEDFHAVLHAILDGFGIKIPESLDYYGAEEEEEEGEEYEDDEEGENGEEEGDKNEHDENNEEDQKEGVKEDDENINKIENQEDKEVNENKIKDMTDSTKEESKGNDDM